MTLEEPHCSSRERKTTTILKQTKLGNFFLTLGSVKRLEDIIYITIEQQTTSYELYKFLKDKIVLIQIKALRGRAACIFFLT